MRLTPLLLLVASCSCATAPLPDSVPLPPIPDLPVSVETMRQETVILVGLEDGGDTAITCSGVWVAPRRILTAAHCTEAELHVITYPEYVIEVDPTLLGHGTKLLGVSEDQDLALLATDDSGTHPWARPASASPPPGAMVSIVGHSLGVLYYSYSPGWVSGPRRIPHPDTQAMGPWLQVVGAAEPGNSGGGLFDDHGHLAGIASCVAQIDGIPQPIGLFTPAEAVSAFLAEHHIGA